MAGIETHGILAKVGGKLFSSVHFMILLKQKWFNIKFDEEQF